MTSFAFTAAALLLGVSTLAYAAPVAVPAKLVAASGGAAAGLSVEVSADATGIVDRAHGAALRLSPAAFGAAASDDERLVLMAMSLSYRVALRDVPGPLDKGVAKLVTGLVAAAVEDNLAGRDRRDPYLQLPTTPRPGTRLPEPAAARSTDARALRGLAWATAAGVCEATALAYLDRLAVLETEDATVASDARAVRRGLGMLGYAPRADCRAG